MCKSCPTPSNTMSPARSTPCHDGVGHYPPLVLLYSRLHMMKHTKGCLILFHPCRLCAALLFGIPKRPLTRVTIWGRVSVGNRCQAEGVSCNHSSGARSHHHSRSAQRSVNSKINTNKATNVYTTQSRLLFLYQKPPCPTFVVNQNRAIPISNTNHGIYRHVCNDPLPPWERNTTLCGESPDMHKLHFFCWK